MLERPLRSAWGRYERRYNNCAERNKFLARDCDSLLKLLADVKWRVVKVVPVARMRLLDVPIYGVLPKCGTVFLGGNFGA
jgi:hypothetical protein